MSGKRKKFFALATGFLVFAGFEKTFFSAAMKKKLSLAKNMILGNITDTIIKNVIEEAKKEENQSRLRCYVLDPVASYIENYLKPYFFTLLIVLLVMVGLLLWILRLMLRIAPMEST